MVHRISSNGKAVSKPPKSFGYTRNDNNVRLASRSTPWDFSFEQTFQDADNSFGSLVDWLKTLSSRIAKPSASIAGRLTPLALTKERELLLAQCCASLIVRSPSLRSRVRMTIESSRRAFGIESFEANQSLVAMNVRAGQQELSRSIVGGGKFAVLLSGENEFIFGDGFFHNVSAVNGPVYSPRFLIPLTPEIAVTYTRPSSYLSHPKALVMNLTPEEVSFVNRTVQIYSGQYLFFREVYPVIDDAFACGAYLQFEYHKHPWIDALHEVMADTNFAREMKSNTAGPC